MSEYVPPHFHFHATWIQAEVGRNAGQAVSAYMQRNSAGNAVSAYMTRSREADAELARESEVAHYFLLTNGLDIDAKVLWSKVDQLSRNRRGEYKTHAGRLPRLGVFINAALPYGVSKDDAINAVECFGKGLADKYGCAVEGVIHYKNGQYDHAHFAIVDRQVGPGGISKTKIRAFNGIAAKASGEGIRDKGKNLAPAMEYMRGLWAAEMRRISRNDRIDHRSFKRQDIDLKPLPYIRRGEIEYQERHGRTDWRDDREKSKRLRAASKSPVIMIPVPARAGKRRQARTFSAMLAAKVLAEHMDPAAAGAAARILSGMGQGASAIRTTLMARLVADRMAESKAALSRSAAEDLRPGLEEAQAPSPSPAYGSSRTPFYSPPPAQVAARAVPAPPSIWSGPDVGLVRTAAAALLQPNSPIAPSPRGAERVTAETISVDFTKRPTRTFYEEEEERQRLMYERLALEAAKDRQRHREEEEEQARILGARAQKQAQELMARMARPAIDAQDPPPPRRETRPAQSGPVPGTTTPSPGVAPTSPPTMKSTPAGTSRENSPASHRSDDRVRIATEYAALLKQGHLLDKTYVSKLAEIVGMSVPEFDREAHIRYQRLFVRGRQKVTGFSGKLTEEAARQGFEEFLKVREEISGDLTKKRSQVTKKGLGLGS